MSEEQLYYYDDNYQRIGEVAKSEARKKGLWVHSFHCWMLSKGDTPSVLLQKRASSKELFPDYLDISAAGHLAVGEDVEDGVREIREEVGLDVKFNDLISLGIKHDVAQTGEIVNRQFCHVFLYPRAPTIESLRLDSVELDGMVSVPVDKGLKLFSGKVDSINVNGVEKEGTCQWTKT